MGRQAAPAHRPAPRQEAGAESARAPRREQKSGPCRGAAAQLAAVHRTLTKPASMLGAAGLGPTGSTPDRANRTGLPDRLKAGIEALSGMAVDDVRVHRNSAAPATLGARAYAQGSEIHLGPGQEQHLAHEAWHVVQQKQGRVRPTMTMAKGLAVNSDPALEREANAMGALSATGPSGLGPVDRAAAEGAGAAAGAVVQGYFVFEGSDKEYRTEDDISTDDIDYGKRQKDFAKIWKKIVEWTISKEKIDKYKNWQEVADAAMEAVPSSESPKLKLDGGPRACLEAWYEGEPKILHKAIMEELRAKPTEKGLEEFSVLILKGTSLKPGMIAYLEGLHHWRKSVKKEQEKETGEVRFGNGVSVERLKDGTYVGSKEAIATVWNSFLRALWSFYGGYFEEEMEEKEGDRSLGSKAGAFNLFGFPAYFTGRTAKGDLDLVAGAIGRLAAIMDKTKAEALAARIMQTLEVDMSDALKRKDKATLVKQTNDQVNDSVAKDAALAVAKWGKIEAYAEAVLRQWEAAKPKTRLVFDRAGLTDVFGQSSPNEATGAKMLAKEPVVTTPQRNTFNLSAMPDPTDLAVTIAHEVAHTIGFNPDQCEDTGHFKDSNKYREEEKGGIGPKLLYDAYYFETLILRLIG